ncbi:hypothetical protein D9M70_469310 [compost metagenome]
MAEGPGQGGAEIEAVYRNGDALERDIPNSGSFVHYVFKTCYGSLQASIHTALEQLGDLLVIPHFGHRFDAGGRYSGNHPHQQLVRLEVVDQPLPPLLAAQDVRSGCHAGLGRRFGRQFAQVVPGLAGRSLQPRTNDGRAAAKRGVERRSQAGNVELLFMDKRVGRRPLIERMRQEQAPDVADSVVPQVLLQIAGKTIEKATYMQGRATGQHGCLTRSGFLAGTGTHGLGEVEMGWSAHG